ncbi:hypothetical protein NC653_024033 [Populus alba x Populus x berolinensis]|uniref:Uncharacterized protein n=1 Tax=Populus alba x Populus x berolinensis TaxID=444605 RepID=A0AAD6QDK8_9ROSI|nr:hypothetical protein NC653_024033 [Populus alba x Populus x berolinensis]
MDNIIAFYQKLLVSIEKNFSHNFISDFVKPARDILSYKIQSPLQHSRLEMVQLLVPDIVE